MQVRHPLSGYPLTIERQDDHGLPAYEIVPQELTPEGALRRAHVLKIARFCLALLILYEWYVHGWSWFALIFVSLICLASYRVVLLLLNRTLRQKTRMVLTCEYVSVQRSGQDWEHIRYPDISGFTMRQHDQTRDEQFQLEYEAQRASQNKGAVRKRLYFGDSFHVTAVHLGQQIDLFTVYGPKDARAIVERLQLCYRMLSGWQAQTATGKAYNDLGARPDI